MARYKYGKLVIDLTDMADGDTITDKSLLQWLESITSIPSSNADARRIAFKNSKDLVLVVSIDNNILKIPMIFLADDTSEIQGCYLFQDVAFYCNIDLTSEPMLGLGTKNLASA